MKKQMLRLLGGLFVVAILAVMIFTKSSTTDYHVSNEETEAAFNLLNESLVRKKHTYFDFVNTSHAKMGTQDYVAQISGGNEVKDPTYQGTVVSIGRDETVTYQVNVPSSGLYEFHIDYQMRDKGLTNPTLSVLVNDEVQFDEAQTIDVPLNWKDQSKEFSIDTYGDESLPQQERVDGWNTIPMYNKLYYTVEPLLFELKAGENTITIINTTSDELYMGTLQVKSPSEKVQYEDYVDRFPQMETDATKIFVNATEYSEKNSSYIRLNSLNQPALTPYDAVYKKLNVIDGNSWKTPGQEITYSFDIEADGWYEIALHYMNDKSDYSVFRSIRIDGEIPFEDLKAYEFSVTNPGVWKNETLSKEDEVFKFYLTEGTHTVSLKAEYEPVSEQIRILQLVNDHINQFSLDIVKVSGKEIDKNRTWRLTKFLPETEAYLKAYQTLIKSVIQTCSEFAPNGQMSSTLSFLNKAVGQLDKMLVDPDELPLYLDRLYSGSGSVSQMIGDTISNLTSQPLFINGFYVSNGETLDKPNASFVSKVLNNTKSFIASFTSKKYVMTEDSDAVNIWVNRPLTYIDTMQKLADSQFTPQTGIKVKISAMPDVNKLIL
ncbi:MAG: hypothetical protein ACRCS6_06340, partial [Turicibacter sp.]